MHLKEMPLKLPKEKFLCLNTKTVKALLSSNQMMSQQPEMMKQRNKRLGNRKMELQVQFVTLL